MNNLAGYWFRLFHWFSEQIAILIVHFYDPQEAEKEGIIRVLK